MKRACLLCALLAAGVMVSASVLAQADRDEEEARRAELRRRLEVLKRREEVLRQREEKARELEQTTKIEEAPKTAPPWSQVLAGRLDQTRVTFDFRKRSLGDVLTALANAGDVNLAVPPDWPGWRREGKWEKLDLELTLTLTDLTLRDAVKRVGDVLHVKPVIVDDMVLLTLAEVKPVAWPKLPDWVDDALDRKLITFDFREQPLDLVLTHLGRRANLDLRLGTTTDKHTITLQGKKMSLRHVLSWIARFEVMEFTARGDAIVLGETRRSQDQVTQRRLRETIVSFTFNQQPVNEVFDFLQTLGNVNIVLDRRTVDMTGKITLKLNNVPLRTAIALSVEQLNLAHALRGGVVYISDAATLAKIAARDRDIAKRAAGEKLRPLDAKTLRKLHETIVSFTFNEQPIHQALDFLQTLGNVNIVFDRRRFDPKKTAVTIKLSNASLATALVLCAEQFGGRCALRDGVVFISDEKTITKGGWPELIIDGANPVKRRRKNLEEVIVTF